MPIKKTPAQKANIDSYKHKDSRKHIPTQELSHLADKSNGVPPQKKYKYDPSLDPQLVWTGKGEKEELVVDTVPVYIQEKISPEAIIHRLKGDDTGPAQLDLFGQSADTAVKDMVDFYQHDNNWTNRMILGDSLQVMNSLLEKEGMRGQVQCVYIDPPYGISFGSNWQVSTKSNVVKDSKDDDYTRQPEQIKAFRDTWELGIHSYLSYLRGRLLVSRELLTDSGSCFMQIGQTNLHLIMNLMDEVFGSSNKVVVIPFRTKKMPLNFKNLDSICDYLVWYAKDIKQLKYRQLYTEKKAEDGYYTYIETKDGEIRKINQDDDLKNNKVFLPLNINSSGLTPSCVFDVKFNGKIYKPRKGHSWMTNKQGMDNLIKKNRIFATEKVLYYKLYHSDFPVKSLTNLWTDTMGAFGKTYVVQTSNKIIERCLLMCSDPGDIILDPTCGSGTTAFVSEQWGRRWITVDTSRVAIALARTRLMSSLYQYYKLRNSLNIKEGFYYKTAPHITLGAIANNEPLKEEILYDKPEIEKNKIRVSGPFTVENLSPHRSSDSYEMLSSENYVERVIDNLSKFGVQTGVKDERLEFEHLEILADNDAALQAAGEYKEGEKHKQVAVAIGPEYGSIDDDMIRAAVKKAGKHYDLLVIAGTSFEGSAFTEGDDTLPAYAGDLHIMKVKINPDLSMDDLLKKTSSGNIFMAFGEPDIEVHTEKGDTIRIEVKGVDVYDATKGTIRSGDVNDIACWFIDTNYNEESFFVNHAYFTGADKPYDKLRKTLKDDINKKAWESIYKTTSRAFKKPSTGKVAVKVINHFGDEVMKVVNVK